MATKFDINDDDNGAIDPMGNVTEAQPHPHADGKPSIPPPGPDQTASEPAPTVSESLRKLSFGGVPMAPLRSTKKTTNTLIYGRPGSGKTFLAATAQKSKLMNDMLYISAEAGASTIRQVDPSIMIIPDPDVAGSVNWEQLLAIYDELDRQCYNTTTGCDFRTVTIDTGTELQKINMTWVMDQTLAAHPDRDPDVPALHDWGKSTNSMRSIIRKFRDLPLNFIFICHEQEDRDNKGLLWKKPDLPGKLANQAAAFFDQVMYLYTKQVTGGDETKSTDIKRILMTGALEGFVTKDRSGNLPLLMVDPTMDKLFQLITKDM
jgi:AAA domain